MLPVEADEAAIQNTDQVTPSDGKANETATENTDQVTFYDAKSDGICHRPVTRL